MDVLIGKMYNKCRDPEQIKRMNYSELKYWGQWNDAIDEGLKQANSKK